MTDKESFLWTRRLVKEEGIFCGGSSSSAVAAAVRDSQQLDAEHLIVVVLPDSGSYYLSKVFDDKWMRENFFLDIEWGEVSLQELLEAKTSPGLICASLKTPMIEVINPMKEHDTSQIPFMQT